ncbi:hypothetical protein [Heyndrickxia oleronia]|uniref:hypothetical protein n=1 Tax=Heyndrickxia oleronia TaxID=38875 RepID=UPI001B258239|nr:hypothetical protein [Heyndrickxia oleronia]GIN38376.1 hypothetical protein J19TS1_13250 [Heyndrickxia oleronia]
MLDFRDHKTGLTQKDEEELLVGKQLVEMELRNLELEQENTLLGNQLVDLDIRLMAGGM